MKKKKNIYIGLILLFAGILSGCSQDSYESPPEDNSIQILSTISTKENARLSDSNFESGDRIGVYIIPYEPDNNTPGSFPQDAYESNIEYAYSGTYWNPTNSEAPVWPGKKKADVYGYYPYNQQLSEHPTATYKFSVQADQRMASAQMQSDFLWAKAEGLSPVKNVRLTFYHRMSLITINVLSQIDISARISDMAVSLMNVNPSASISMSDGLVTLNSSGEHTEIHTLTLPDAVSGYDNSNKGIIPPQTIAKDTRFIKIALNGVNYFYQPNEDIVLESGKHTVFNIVITKLGLNVNYSTISEWLDGGTFDNSLGTKAPLVVDLNTIDWNRSLVHNICNKDIPIARVSKEYLFKSGLVDAQAIVVYPMGTEGTPDLTQGFVAQVMKRNYNTTTGLYEPNSSNVHGGSVNFNVSDNTLTNYSAGKSALINKIEVTTDGRIAKANDSDIVLLTTQPVVMTDIDKNIYPIVKIGTQYWTAQNYRAEHYQNGDPLTYYYFNDNKDYKNTLGALYTWTTITDSRGIAPHGWQVPGEPDWQSVYRYLTPSAGMKLRATTMWTSLTYADNVTGFSGLPGGRRTNTGTYNEINSYGQWWSSTLNGTDSAYRLYLASGDYAMHLTTLGTSYTQSLRLVTNTPL
ncbi:fimbrillin family protein [Bacteroides sp. 51]|uniref:fimbrillin family protein n=1 Tax=Bacteroides sp. 51 TaxID=2302938 RepID=UPI0013D24F58|nr:fimbrillin family protein [Bacteroides sp. 51]NDV83338.1 hypothetical protein [Bacteroides sp. 51]